jgi:hypothetical protein
VKLRLTFNALHGVISQKVELFITVGSQPYPPLTPGRFLVLISVRGLVDSRAIVRLEELSQFNNLMNSSAIEPATFLLVNTASQLTTLPRSHTLYLSALLSLLTVAIGAP